MWGTRKKENVIEDVISGMQEIYETSLKPLEQKYHFQNFHSPLLDEADFKAKPMVLLIGQYSTGKTTFIKYID